MIALLCCLLMGDPLAATVQVGGCSGVCVSPRGLVLTVKHDGLHDEEQIVFPDGRSGVADCVFICPEHDGPVAYQCRSVSRSLPFVSLAASPPRIGIAVRAAGYSHDRGHAVLQQRCGRIVDAQQFASPTGPIPANITDFGTPCGWYGGPVLSGDRLVGLNGFSSQKQTGCVSHMALVRALDAIARGKDGRNTVTNPATSPVATPPVYAPQPNPPVDSPFAPFDAPKVPDSSVPAPNIEIFELPTPPLAVEATPEPPPQPAPSAPPRRPRPVQPRPSIWGYLVGTAAAAARGVAPVAAVFGVALPWAAPAAAVLGAMWWALRRHQSRRTNSHGRPTAAPLPEAELAVPEAQQQDPRPGPLPADCLPRIKVVEYPHDGFARLFEDVVEMYVKQHRPDRPAVRRFVEFLNNQLAARGEQPTRLPPQG